MERARWSEVMTPEILTRAQNYAHWLLPYSQEDAEDLYAEGLLKAWRYFDRFDNAFRYKGPHVQVTTPAGTWLNTIIRNVLRDRGRYARAHPEHTALSLNAPGVSDVVDRYESAPDCAQIVTAQMVGPTEACLAEMPPHFRAILVASVVEQMKYEEIAARFGIKTGTVRSRISRARAYLKAACAAQSERDIMTL